MRNVVVPLEGSELSLSVLGPLRRLLAPALAAAGTGGARRTTRLGPRLVLMRAVSEAGARAEHEFATARRELEEACAELERLGVAACVRVVRGEPVASILECAREHEADLVAMATHARTGAARLVMGSVAEEVLRRSETPLLLVNPHTFRAPVTPVRRLLLALDGSTTSQAAAPIAAGVARASGAEVVLAHVAPDDAAADLGRAALEHAASALGDDVASRAALVLGGDPAAALCELVERERAELIVMTTHGRQGLARAWLGSVAEEVVRNAVVPVLVRRTASPG